MTASAAAGLGPGLEASLGLVGSSGEGSATFLEPFNRVDWLDRTEVPVPVEWESLGSGGGNQNRRRAGLKLPTWWDDPRGGLPFSWHPAGHQDAG